jgi:hypothetical protein
LAVNGMDARVLWVRASVTGLLSQAILGKATDPYLYAHFEARGIHNGLVAFTFRSLNSFMRPFVRMPRGFCHLAMSDVGAGYKSH